MKSSARLDHSSPLSRSAGFTLIELLLAIAILGILSAVAIPQLNGIYNRQVLINAANEVVSSLKQTQNMAMTNNQQPYDRPPYVNNDEEITNDCSATRPYILRYEFRMVDTSSYNIQRIHKSTNDAAQSCMTPATNPALEVVFGGANKKLPHGVTFTAYSSLGVRFDTSTTKLATDSPSPLGPTRASYRLNHQAVDASVLTYYICVESGRAYAQTTTCFE